MSGGREPWESDPDAWRGDDDDDDDLGEPPIDDEIFEDWGLIIKVPGLELQIHDDLGVIVAIVSPVFKEMISKLEGHQDRLAWAFTPDDDPDKRKNIHDALIKSLGITPPLEDKENTDDD